MSTSCSACCCEARASGCFTSCQAPEKPARSDQALAVCKQAVIVPACIGQSFGQCGQCGQHPPCDLAGVSLLQGHRWGSCPNWTCSQEQMGWSGVSSWGTHARVRHQKRSRAQKQTRMRHSRPLRPVPYPNKRQQTPCWAAAAGKPPQATAVAHSPARPHHRMPTLTGPHSSRQDPASAPISGSKGAYKRKRPQA